METEITHNTEPPVDVPPADTPKTYSGDTAGLTEAAEDISQARADAAAAAPTPEDLDLASSELSRRIASRSGLEAVDLSHPVPFDPDKPMSHREAGRLLAQYHLQVRSELDQIVGEQKIDKEEAAATEASVAEQAAADAKVQAEWQAQQEQHERQQRDVERARAAYQSTREYHEAEALATQTQQLVTGLQQLDEQATREFADVAQATAGMTEQQKATWLANFARIEPQRAARLQQFMSAYSEGKARALQTANAAQSAAQAAQHAVAAQQYEAQRQFYEYGKAEDAKICEARPELNDAKAMHAKGVEVMEYLTSELGLSEQQVS